MIVVRRKKKERQIMERSKEARYLPRSDFVTALVVHNSSEMIIDTNGCDSLVILKYNALIFFIYE
jgi:hypothetical protein